VVVSLDEPDRAVKNSEILISRETRWFKAKIKLKIVW